MISSSEIRVVLDSLPKNVYTPINDIQLAVKDIVLPEDLNVPYTESRPHNNYPKWKHRLQAVLHNYKIKGKVLHDKSSKSYMFY